MDLIRTKEISKSVTTRKRNSKRKGKRKTPTSLKFLKSTHTVIRMHLAAASDLPTFLETAGALNLKGRRKLVEQALVLIDENFVHLPLKESMHGVDPVQKLRLLQHQLDQTTTSKMGSEFEFHREMINIFNSVRDLHTNYLLPAPFADKVAFLPFDIEECFDNGKPHYIASHLVQGFTHPHFKKGVEITMWNGIPIDRAIAISADKHAGSNLAARHVRGIDGLTIRALRRALPPDEMWVVIGYTDLHGVEREMRQDWIVTPTLPDTGGVDTDSRTTAAASQGIDIEADIVQRTRKMLFAPKVIAEERKHHKISKHKAGSGQSLTSTMPGVFSAKNVSTPSGEFGYIRIFTFSVNNPEAFINEFIRLVELLPQQGLIVDVRGNGGGHIYASEGLLQVLTNVDITPEPTQFINTPLNLRMCKRHETNPTGQIDLGPWTESINQSVETGAIYSRGFPITPTEFANMKGQKYHGPVVLITDARCYSATDIFAAGFKDHEIGHILGVDDNTGAGGANVWTHGLLQALLQFPPPADPESPYKNLPNGADMRVAIRRTLRVGDQSGTPLEDLGVTPDSRHAMTEDDLLNGNVDLINRAGKILKNMPVRQLGITTSQSGSTLNIQATTIGLSRLDTYIDGRPMKSIDISNGTHNFQVTRPAGATLLEFAGYKNGDFVAARKIEL